MASINALPSHNGSSGPEVVNAAPGDATTQILEPLLFLLAARRGVRSDPDIESMNIPDEKCIIYLGKSGVNVINKPSRVNRILFVMGHFGANWNLPVAILVVTSQIMKALRLALKLKADDDKQSLLPRETQLNLLATAIIWLFFIGAKIYTRKGVAASTPPQFDPSSYQCRLEQAMNQRGLYHRKIVTNSWEQMQDIWKNDMHVTERFHIEGLSDHRSPWAYDINVRFWNDGKVTMAFAPREENSKKHTQNLGVHLRPVDEINQKEI